MFSSRAAKLAVSTNCVGAFGELCWVIEIPSGGGAWVYLRSGRKRAAPVRPTGRDVLVVIGLIVHQERLSQHAVALARKLDRLALAPAMPGD